MEAVAGCEIIKADLIVENAQDLEVLDLPKLKELYGELLVDLNDKLHTVRMDALETSGAVGVPRGEADFEVAGPALKEVSFASLSMLGSATIPTGMRVRGPVEKLNLPKLNRVFGGFSLSGTKLTELSSPVTELAELSLADNASLTAARFPQLKKVGTDLRIAGTPLTTLELPVLRQVGGPNTRGVLDLKGLGALDTLSLPALEEVALSLTIDDNPGLKAISIDGTIAKIPVVYVRGNAALTSLSIPHLSEATTFNVNGNGELSTISFTDLRKSDHFEFNSNSKLPTCSIKALVDQLKARDGVFQALYANNLADSCS